MAQESGMSALSWIAFLLVIVGGLNWGLIAIGVGNVVEMILGVGTITDIVYGLVGLSAIYALIKIASK